MDLTGLGRQTRSAMREASNVFPDRAGPLISMTVIGMTGVSLPGELVPSMLRAAPFSFYAPAHRRDKHRSSFPAGWPAPTPPGGQPMSPGIRSADSPGQGQDQFDLAGVAADRLGDLDR